MENTIAAGNEMLKVFENSDFGKVRVVMKDGEPWFVAADACKALEIGNSTQALSRLDDDEKRNTLISNEGNRGNPNVVVVSEPGLYTLVLGSRKPEAKAFKRWITHEVVPAIRRSGGYSEKAAFAMSIQNPRYVAGLLTELADEQEKRKMAEAENAKLQGTIAEQKPLVDFASTIQTARESVSMIVAARMLSHDDFKISRTKLFMLLRGKHILMSGKNADEWNLPYQQYIDSGYFEVETNTYTGHWGETCESFTTKVTPKGQMWIANNIRKWMRDLAWVA